MPQSFTRLYAHLIFSTKERWPWLDDIARPQMHAHLAAAMREMGSPYVVVGGVADHVHLLFDMGKMLAPATLVKEVKRVSSKFAKTLGPKYEQFYWQRGYGMFSVSPTHRADVEAYIRRNTIARDRSRTSSATSSYATGSNTTNDTSGIDGRRCQVSEGKLLVSSC